MGVPICRGPHRSAPLWCPALPVVVFLLLSSCATLTAPSPPRVQTASPAQGSGSGATAPTPMANDSGPSAGRPQADLLAPAQPVPASPVPEITVVDLPAPALPRTLSVPVIPQPRLAPSAQPAAPLRGAPLDVVRVASPPAHPAARTERPSSPTAGTSKEELQKTARPAVTAASGAERSAAVPAAKGSATSPSSPVRPASTTSTPALPTASSGGPVQGAASRPSSGSQSTAVQAPPSSPPAAGTGSRSGSHSASAGRTPPPRTVYAKVGDDITIALNGQGWTFTGGAGGGERWKGGVRYESRSSDPSGMTFVFKAMALGKWTLGFQQQNAVSGRSSEQTFDVRVLSPSEFARTIGAKATGATSAEAATGSGAYPGNASGGAGGSAANRQLAAAEWLYKEGKYPEALTAYERAWQPDDPALTEKIAELAYRVGRFPEARKYWQKNFDLTGTQYGDLAVAGLMKTATAQKDAPELRALFDYVHALKGVSIREDLLSAGHFLYRVKDWNVALRYLDEYLKRYNGREGADVADYLLGEIYSGPTPMQDAHKAMSYFRRIVSDYPMSDYYERAKANIVYLNRQFFEIR